MQNHARAEQGWTALLVVAALAVMSPFWPSLLLALWLGGGGLLWMPTLTRWARGRRHIAAFAVVLGVGLVAVPIIAMLYTVAVDAWAFVARAMDSDQMRDVLQELVGPSEGSTEASASAASAATEGSAALPASGSGDPAQLLWEGSGASTEGSGRTGPAARASQAFFAWVQLAVQYSERAWSAVQYLAGAAIQTTLDLVVFFVVLYAVLLEGPAGWTWCVRNSPLPEHHTVRYAAAFRETGRGLVVGFGGAAIAQASVGLILFAAVGVSRALVLGALMFVASAIPSIGTAIVWGPVALGLALTGRTEAAIVVLVVGVAVIGSIDNLLRPVLARYGQLNLPTHLVFVSMLGGLLLLGAGGLLAGPLLVRLAAEALELRREDRERGAVAHSPPSPDDSE